jgi:hypothetical protein
MAAPVGPVRKHTARGTEPGLQAPWHFYLSGYKAAMCGELSGGVYSTRTSPISLSTAAI